MQLPPVAFLQALRLRPEGCCTVIGGKSRQSHLGSTFPPSPGWRSGASVTREITLLGQVRLPDLICLRLLGLEEGA